MYDWTTVIVAVFPPFFSEYAAVGLDPVDATSRFAWGTTIAVTIVALMAPVLGAIAHHRALKKKLLAVFLGGPAERERRVQRAFLRNRHLRTIHEHEKFTYHERARPPF